MRLRGGAESRLSSMLSSTADTHCLTAPYPLQHSTTLYNTLQSTAALQSTTSTPPLSFIHGLASIPRYQLSHHAGTVLALSQESRGTSQNLSFPAAASSDMADDGAFTLTCERVE